MVEVIMMTPREINETLNEFSSLNELQYLENTIIDLHRLNYRSQYVLYLLSIVFNKLEEPLSHNYPEVRMFLHGSPEDYLMLEVEAIDRYDEESIILESIINMEYSSIAKAAFDLINCGYRIEVEDLIEDVIMTISKISRLLFAPVRPRGKFNAAFYTEGGLLICVPMIDP